LQVPARKITELEKQGLLDACKPLFDKLAKDIEEGNLKIDYAMEFVDYGSKGVPRRVPFDDNHRQVIKAGPYVITRISPSTTQFLAAYNVEKDQLMFIVDGTPVPVPVDWLSAYNKGIARVRGKNGHNTRMLNHPVMKLLPEERTELASRLRKTADELESGDITELRRGVSHVWEELASLHFDDPPDDVPLLEDDEITTPQIATTR
jgi:hypothetical protein